MAPVTGEACETEKGEVQASPGYKGREWSARSPGSSSVTTVLVLVALNWASESLSFEPCHHLVAQVATEGFNACHLDGAQLNL